MVLEVARKSPGYGFGAHKGYGTAMHRQALQSLGPSPVHRFSYRPVGRLAGVPVEGTHHRGVDDAWNAAGLLASLLVRRPAALGRPPAPPPGDPGAPRTARDRKTGAHDPSP